MTSPINEIPQNPHPYQKDNETTNYSLRVLMFKRDNKRRLVADRVVG
jgi:hypothetical protein